MRIFLAGIMQGSQLGTAMHNQQYRRQIGELLREHLPEAEVYDPLAGHGNSLDYDDQTARRVFLGHIDMCRQIDVLLAFVPKASMGTAIEMWQAHQCGQAVVTISPLKHNWAVKFLSDVLYGDLPQFEEELTSGRLAARLEQIRSTGKGDSNQS
jgi:hypothetical protein